MRRLLLIALISLCCPTLMGQVSLPYGVGYNFEICTDSLCLQVDRPMHWSEGVALTSDSLWLYDEAVLVVAEFCVIPEDSVDSVWVKVAHNQFMMGWLHESDLRRNAHPDNPISAFMHTFQATHRQWMAAIFALSVLVALCSLIYATRTKAVVRLPLYKDIRSIYPLLLVLSVVASALLCSYLRHSHPALWEAFYFYPTLNPFVTHSPLNWFLISVWLMPLFAIATIDDLFRRLPSVNACIYIMVLFGWCALLFEVINCI